MKMETAIRDSLRMGKGVDLVHFCKTMGMFIKDFGNME